MADQKRNVPNNAVTHLAKPGDVNEQSFLEERRQRTVEVRGLREFPELLDQSWRGRRRAEEIRDDTESSGDLSFKGIHTVLGDYTLRSFLVARRSSRLLVALAILVTGFSRPALAAEDPDQRWGISIWGLSYHIDDEIDFDEANVGLGLRYYVVNHRVFVEVDALRNSNGGLAVPVSAGIDLKVASLGQACNLYTVAAGTVVYYQNARTEREDVKVGPVPGVTLGCGRLKTNAIVVLRPSRQPVSVIAASLTIMLR